MPEPDDELTGALGFDGLEMYLLLEFLAEIAAPVPDELVPHLIDADDVYYYYTRRAGDP